MTKYWNIVLINNGYFYNNNYQTFYIDIIYQTYLYSDSENLSDFFFLNVRDDGGLILTDGISPLDEVEGASGSRAIRLHFCFLLRK